jgi:hypothetical protein
LGIQCPDDKTVANLLRLQDSRHTVIPRKVPFDSVGLKAAGWPRFVMVPHSRTDV